MTNEEMREESGNIFGNTRLQLFLYLLMRDYILPGTIEKIVNDIDEYETAPMFTAYTNGWLAMYAKNLEARLMKE
jgi:hypothetical protein